MSNLALAKHSKVKDFWDWYKCTSMLVGMPLLLTILLIGIQKFVFTGTCQTVGWRCEYSFTSQSSAANYLTELVSAGTADIEVKPRKR